MTQPYKRTLFETAEDVNLKLGSCVILKDDNPIFVKQYSGGNNSSNFRVFYTPIPMFKRSRDYDECEVNDKSLDWRGMNTRLGYMNANRANDQREALYVQRTPARKSYQGLHNQNTKISPWTFDNTWGFEGGATQLDHHLRDDYFLDMMSNKYMSISECLRHFKEHPKTLSRAFHRHFAIKRPRIGPYYLEYKRQDIAWSDDPDHKWKLGKEFEYLQETLEYSGIAI